MEEFKGQFCWTLRSNITALLWLHFQCADYYFIFKWFFTGYCQQHFSCFLYFLTFRWLLLFLLMFAVLQLFISYFKVAQLGESTTKSIWMYQCVKKRAKKVPASYPMSLFDYLTQGDDARVGPAVPHRMNLESFYLGKKTKALSHCSFNLAFIHSLSLKLCHETKVAIDIHGSHAAWRCTREPFSSREKQMSMNQLFARWMC